LIATETSPNSYHAHAGEFASTPQYSNFAKCTLTAYPK